jgi:hypothetical protein
MVPSFFLQKSSVRNDRTKQIFSNLEGILIIFAIITPPIAFVGSVLLGGAGHGPVVLWEAYSTPFGIGFFLPSIGAVLVTCSRRKSLILVGVIVELVALLIEAMAFLDSIEDRSYLKHAFKMLPIITCTVAAIGPVTCILAVTTGLTKIKYSSGVPNKSSRL